VLGSLFAVAAMAGEEQAAASHPRLSATHHRVHIIPILERLPQHRPPAAAELAAPYQLLHLVIIAAVLDVHHLASKAVLSHLLGDSVCIRTQRHTHRQTMLDSCFGWVGGAPQAQVVAVCTNSCEGSRLLLLLLPVAHLACQRPSSAHSLCSRAGPACHAAGAWPMQARHVECGQPNHPAWPCSGSQHPALPARREKGQAVTKSSTGKAEATRFQPVKQVQMDSRWCAVRRTGPKLSKSGIPVTF
jgi:hypothetical protein